MTKRPAGRAAMIGALVGATFARAALADERVGPADTGAPTESVRPPNHANVVRDSVALDASFWPTETNGTNVPLILAAQHRLLALPLGTLMGAVTIPVAVATSDNPKQGSGAAWGNPTATLTYALETRTLTAFIGARASAPAASGGDANSDIVVERAAAAHAYYDFALWSVGYVPLSLPFGLEAQPLPALWLRATFEPILYAPIDAWATTKASFQTELAIEGRGTNGAGCGLAFRGVGHGVFRSPRDKPDDTQTALEPYFVYDHVVLARAGVLVALDPPLGWNRDNLGMVVLHVAIGLRLDALFGAAERPPTSAGR